MLLLFFLLSLFAFRFHIPMLYIHSLFILQCKCPHIISDCDHQVPQVIVPHCVFRPWGGVSRNEVTVEPPKRDRFGTKPSVHSSEVVCFQRLIISVEISRRDIRSPMRFRCHILRHTWNVRDGIICWLSILHNGWHQTSIWAQKIVPNQTQDEKTESTTNTLYDDVIHHDKKVPKEVTKTGDQLNTQQYKNHKMVSVARSSLRSSRKEDEFFKS